MILHKQDLKNIGHTAYKGDDGNLVIVSFGDYLGIERILIRNILLQFGDYTITDEGDKCYDDGYCDYEFVTNLPWDKYEELW